MSGKMLKPGDPEVVAYVVDRIRKMTREELPGRFRRREDFDEAWVRPSATPASLLCCQAGS